MGKQYETTFGTHKPEGSQLSHKVYFMGKRRAVKSLDIYHINHFQPAYPAPPREKHARKIHEHTVKDNVPV